MIVLLTALGFLAIGLDLTLRAWPRDLRPLERTTFAIVIGAAMWCATSWMLALPMMLTKPLLIARAAIVVAAAAMLFRQRGRIGTLQIDNRAATVVLLALLPVMLWTQFVLWRGAIIPPVSHDALAYHLPKAVLWSRANGFRYLEELAPAARKIPANYEMLLTEMVATQGRDDYTEWPSTAFWIFFVVAAGALADRWWRGKFLVPLAAMIFAAGLPVALLHSGAHKNDLLIAATMVSMMIAAGRWISEGELPSLIVLILATGLAVGTKPQAATLFLCLAPFLLPRVVKLRVRNIAALAAFGIAAFLLLGGAVYVANFVRERALFGSANAEMEVVTYGDWANLWQAPYVLLAAPFSASSESLRVPWASEPWFWKRYELYFSHFGIPFALCAVAAPFFAFRHRGKERVLVTLAALAAFAFMLPVVFKPHGMFLISLPRYALFIAPVVFAWTVAPLALRRMRAAYALLAVGAISFSIYAMDSAVHDTFAPLEYVLWSRENPGTRVIPFDPGRAASVVDAKAGPHDKIGVDASFASWIHPLFGRDLTRPVHFFPETDGPVVIPDDVDWIVIDRSWHVSWEAAGFTDLSQARRFINKGQPRPEDLRVRRAVVADKRFKVDHARIGWNQVVFRRIR
ncbi:MAG TPA: hypothetical protein VF911_11400 [Thermoanaerobaculia bacterium]|jgi:hypothetical protein